MRRPGSRNCKKIMPGGSHEGRAITSFKQYEKGYLPPGAADVNGFLTQLLQANKLVFQARLDLSDGKPARLKAIEETIKEVDPIVAKLEKKYKSGTANTLVPYHSGLWSNCWS